MRDAASGVPIALLASRFKVVRRTIYGVLQRSRAAEDQVDAPTVSISVRVSREDARALDAAIGVFGIASRASAIRAFLRAPAGYMAPDQDLNDAVRELRSVVAPVANNVNQLVRAKNTDRLKGIPVKLTAADDRLLRDLLVVLERVEATQQDLLGHRIRVVAGRFAAALTAEAQA